MERRGMKFMGLVLAALLVASVAVAAAEPTPRNVFYSVDDPSPAPVSTVRWTVQPGDTLSEIALATVGDPARASEIARINGIEDPRRLRTGQILQIPAPRLALRARLERERDCVFESVEESDGFRDRDRVRLRLQPNAAGHLYLFNLGTTGALTRLFPDARIHSGDSHLDRRQEVLIPPEGGFVVGGPPGVDRLVAVHSLQPVPALEAMASGAPLDESARRLVARYAPGLSGTAMGSAGSRNISFVKESGGDGSTFTAPTAAAAASHPGHLASWFDVDHGTAPPPSEPSADLPWSPPPALAPPALALDSRDLYYRPDGAHVGLQHRVVLVQECSRVEVPASRSFVEGERIYLQLESNRDAQRVVVLQGSSGRWRVGPLQTSRAFRSERYPTRRLLEFDDQPGTEVLWVLQGERLPEQVTTRLGRSGDPAADPAWAQFVGWIEAQSAEAGGRDFVELSSGEGGSSAYARWDVSELSPERSWQVVRIPIEHRGGEG